LVKRAKIRNLFHISNTSPPYFTQSQQIIPRHSIYSASNPQPPSKNEIELKEKEATQKKRLRRKRGYAEKEAQRGANRHKEA
jgi:hypothetical protein